MVVWIGNLDVVVGDWFDVFVVGFLVEMDEVECVVEIGECECVLIVCGCCFDDVVNVYDVVGNWEFGVNVKMDEVRIWYGCYCSCFVV